MWENVSTHSRPKAAGYFGHQTDSDLRRFNSQPPEGGWLANIYLPFVDKRFQLTAARRRLAINTSILSYNFMVSTHSRPKAAGQSPKQLDWPRPVSTHSRPKAAGLMLSTVCDCKPVSTHSRPKAAGRGLMRESCGIGVSTHSRPKAAGCPHRPRPHIPSKFQLTAARRRLVPLLSRDRYSKTFQLTAARRRLV